MTDKDAIHVVPYEWVWYAMFFWDLSCGRTQAKKKVYCLAIVVCQCMRQNSQVAFKPSFLLKLKPVKKCYTVSTPDAAKYNRTHYSQWCGLHWMRLWQIPTVIWRFVVSRQPLAVQCNCCVQCRNGAMPNTWYIPYIEMTIFPHENPSNNVNVFALFKITLLQRAHILYCRCDQINAIL